MAGLSLIARWFRTEWSVAGLKSGAILALAIAVPATCRAQQSPAPPSLVTHMLRGGTGWIEGGASNTAFVIGDHGVIVFDAQKTVSAGRAVLAEIAKITPKPVNVVLLSHDGPDHVGGLPAFPLDATIISQENTRSSIQEAIADNGGRYGPANYPLYHALEHLLPKHTIANSESVVLNGIHIILMYVAPAHTSGDMIAYLPDQKIVFGGDVITTISRFPIIHPGGSTLGWIAFMTSALALDADTYVSGHGQIEAKAQLQARLRDAEQRRDQVKAMVEQGASLAAVRQALPEQGIGPFETFTEVVYRDLKKGYPPPQP